MPKADIAVAAKQTAQLAAQMTMIDPGLTIALPLADRAGAALPRQDRVVVLSAQSVAVVGAASFPKFGIGS